MGLFDWFKGKKYELSTGFTYDEKDNALLDEKFVSFLVEGTAFLKLDVKEKIIEELISKNYLETKNNYLGKKKHGEWITYFEQSEKIGSREFFKNGNLVEMKLYYHNGNLKQELNFEDGELHGITTSYYENEKIQGINSYKKGLKHGEFMSYFENGQLHYKYNFIEGQEDGAQLNWFQDGKLDIEKNMKNGVQHGLYRQFYENGQIEYQVVYDEGEPIGIKQFFGKNGELIDIEGYSKYFKGTPVIIDEIMNNSFRSKRNEKEKQQKEEANKQGVTYEKYKINLKGLKKDIEDDNGENIIYYSNGNVKERYFKENGLRKGYCQAYFKDGRLMYEGNDFKDSEGKQDALIKRYYYNEDHTYITEVITLKKYMFYEIRYMDFIINKHTKSASERDAFITELKLSGDMCEYNLKTVEEFKEFSLFMKLKQSNIEYEEDGSIHRKRFLRMEKKL